MTAITEIAAYESKREIMTMNLKWFRNIYFVINCTTAMKKVIKTKSFKWMRQL